MRCNGASHTETGMYPDNPDNPMIRGAQDQLERESANAYRQGKAYSMMVDEFLEACVDGLDAPLSYGPATTTLAAVLSELLETECIALHLARKYAERQLADYIELGAFDD